MSGVPLWLNAKQARCGIPDTDWDGVHFGEKKFRRLVRAGVIPSWVDPETVGNRVPTRYYSRLALEAWALRNGQAA